MSTTHIMPLHTGKDRSVGCDSQTEDAEYLLDYFGDVMWKGTMTAITCSPIL